MRLIRFALVAAATETEMAGVAQKIGRWAPKPIDPANVHVRRFLAANSNPSKDDILRIKKKAIQKLARLYPGAAVMRNHGMFSSEDMPIGTVFDAHSRAAENDVEELVLDFYLPRGDALGDMAARYIDLGVWKEGSIHAAFARAECSICGKSLDPEDRDACRAHDTGEKYEGELARVDLDDPQDTPEFSLCWSGRLAGTRALSQEVLGTVAVGRFLKERHQWMLGLSGARSHGNSWIEGLTAHG